MADESGPAAHPPETAGASADALHQLQRLPPDWTGLPPDPDEAWYDTLPKPPEGERSLDGVRVRQLAAARRGAYRARSYFVIALGACVVAAAQLVLMTVRHV